jgi:hypothetical protein
MLGNYLVCMVTWDFISRLQNSVLFIETVCIPIGFKCKYLATAFPLLLPQHYIFFCMLTALSGTGLLFYVSYILWRNTTIARQQLGKHCLQAEIVTETEVIFARERLGKRSFLQQRMVTESFPWQHKKQRNSFTWWLVSRHVAVINGNAFINSSRVRDSS